MSRNIFGEPVMDANAFWEKISSCDSNDAIKDDNNAIINSGDGGIYNIRRRKVFGKRSRNV